MSSEARPPSPHLDSLARLEGVHPTQSEVLFTPLGRGRGATIHARLDHARRLPSTHVMVPLFGSEQEVEVRDATRTPGSTAAAASRSKGRIVVEPLAEIALYACSQMVWRTSSPLCSKLRD